MTGIWQVVVVLLAAGLLIEAVFLVALMRQVGNLLLQGGVPGERSGRAEGWRDGRNPRT